MSIEAKFRITAQLEQSIKALSALKSEITGVQSAAEKGNSGTKPFAAMSAGAGQLTDKLTSLRDTVTQVVAAVAGIQLGRNTLAMIDAYNGLTARLRVTTGSQLLFNQALAAARDLSAQYSTGLADTAKLLDRIYASIAPLGGTIGNATTATEALLASLKISGATAEETSSAILQFSQALGKGVLNGDEFNSINEAAPGLLRALGEALGKSTSDLKKMGEQGTLTSDVIIKAASIALPKLRESAAAIGPTIGGSFTQVNNALTEFVGRAGQANGTARLIANGMKLLADNIGLVVNAVGVLTGGVLLSWIARLAGSLPSLIAGIAGVGIAIRAVLGFITGPLGLVVTLVSLAAAWVGVDVAQRGAAVRSLESIKAQRDAVQKLIDTLNAKNAADQASGTNTATFGRQAALDRNKAQLAELDAEIAKLEKRADATTDQVDIRADGPLKAKLEENKGKRKLDEEYARDRVLIESQSAKAIAALRAQGRNADADNLAVDAQQSLVRLKKNHDDAIKALTKDETNTRIAQYVAEYDRIAELVSDGTARELKAIQSSYDEQLIATSDYFAKKGALEDAGKREAITKLETEIAERRAVIEKNRSVRTNGVNDAAALAEANKREQEAINKLEVDRVKAQRDLNDGVRDRAIEESKATDLLLRQRQETDLQIKSANDLVTLADNRLRLENQYADARRKEFNETGDTKQTDQLISTQLRVAELTRLKAQFGDLNQALVLQEQSLTQQVDLGAITTEEAEKRKFAARAQALPQLESILRALQAVAATAGDQNAVEELRQRIVALKGAVTDFQASAKTSAVSSLSTALTDISTGAKSAKDSLTDMVTSFAKSMLDVLNKKLAEKLVAQFTDAIASSGSSSGGSGGSWVSLIASLFSSFHTGGVVGAGGGAKRSVSPAVFALAPRYHMGGIAGLRPNEVPAILEQGEEVLTRGDPRHTANGSSGSAAVGDVNISVQVSGAQGSEVDQRSAAGQLTAQVTGVINEWAARQSRQGGILATRR